MKRITFRSELNLGEGGIAQADVYADTNGVSVVLIHVYATLNARVDGSPCNPYLDILPMITLSATLRLKREAKREAITRKLWLVSDHIEPWDEGDAG